MTLGEKLQQLRKEMSLSQEQLAARISVSRQAVSKWELGDSMPDTENIIQLSELFNVSTDYLLKENAERNDIKAGGNHIDERSGKWATISLGIICSGLIIAIIGWLTWQTLIPVGLGILTELCGCVIFAVKCSPKISSKRIKHIIIGVWLLMPIPVWLLVFLAFRYYPRPYIFFAPHMVSITLYIIVSIVITIFMQKRAK